MIVIITTTQTDHLNSLFLVQATENRNKGDSNGCKNLNNLNKETFKGLNYHNLIIYYLHIARIITLDNNPLV